MFVTTGQKLFTYLGYYANGFAREGARNVERLTRPALHPSSLREIQERTKPALSAVVLIPLAGAMLVPAFICYAIAACLGRSRFELIQPYQPANFWEKRSIKIMSLNACFQDPWSPLTGGVITPFTPIAHLPTRIEAVVNAIIQQDPAIFMGQEFDNLGAQDECIRLLKQKGFHYFLRDLGSNDPIKNHSGLFVASKVPLQNISFVPYPPEDRVGLAKWSNQGALSFTVSVNDKSLKCINVHLNYGQGMENQSARNRQLKRHVMPLLNKEPSILCGDFNFNTALVERAAWGAIGFVNAFEGKVTCTDAGKHMLRNKSMHPGGQPCTDCQERIDAFVYHPDQIQALATNIKPLIVDNKLLSDHYALIATVQIVN